jgi:hypothetical protein
MVLFHVRRAMEIAKCSPTRSNPQEKELFERGYVVE